MSVWAAIPLRGFASAKSRLADALDTAGRTALNQAFFAHVTACATEVLGVERVMVVSPDGAVIDAARTMGLSTLREPDGLGLNGALTLAKDTCAAKGATAMLSLSCDLPYLSPADLEAALDAWTGVGAMVLATDEAGSGTNALIVPTRADFTFEMGPGSAVRHRRLAERAGFQLAELNRFGLAFDVDTPDDLTRWRGLAMPTPAEAWSVASIGAESPASTTPTKPEAGTSA